MQPTPDTTASVAEPLLAIKGLTAGYGKVDRNGVPRSVVLHDIDLAVPRGGMVGVIGESGSGKSTLARVIAGLVTPTRGTIRFQGSELPPTLAQRSREQFRRIQIVFQNADTALNPAHTVERILTRPLSLYHGLAAVERRARVAQLLELVRLPAAVASRNCGALSGGQKQRVNLARALAAEPDLILCDEVTSALDTVVGAAILELIAELRRELNLACVFISHDISTVRAICDDIVVLYAGRKVEQASRATLLQPPRHPYTELLVNSVPELRTGWLESLAPTATPIALTGVATPGDAALCSYLARCPLRIDGLCNTQPPVRRVTADHKEILCHLDGQPRTGPR
jgi:peptide/nickel transport system ATP-binding protein